MSVIPDFVIEGWKEQYDEGSDLWAKYPEFGVIERDKIRKLAEKDRAVVQMMTKGADIAPDCPLYLASTGAPLAGKSTVLDQALSVRAGIDAEGVKVDPDRWGMLFMTHLYHGFLMSAGMVADAPDYEYAQKRAYDVARPASNFLTLEVFNEAVNEGKHIVHGTTMTSPHAGGLLKSLSAKGYEVELLVCAAPDDVRAASAQSRVSEQGYYQATPEDIKSKALDFPRRLKDYFEHADRLSLYWRESAKGHAVKVASFQNGMMSVHNAAQLAAFTQDYGKKRAQIIRDSDGQEQLLPLKDLVQRHNDAFRRRKGLGRGRSL